MCVAVPMLVEAVDEAEETAVVSLSGNRLTVDVSLLRPRAGDYVLVHAGCAIGTVSKTVALEALEIFAELERLAADGCR